ncbi:MAG: sulfite exporter TauE/SafE family protein [Chitinivibrionales bacterium]|nr:sulfite exporter TauE/SafE family protein [Chitinivibrionales bacterium]
MEYAIICLAAIITSGLTLFSGFGLGTMLMPVFAIFFPIDIAVALTAIVHFSNNLFKLALLGKFADVRVVLRFGIPAAAASFLGAQLLINLSDLRPLLAYYLGGHSYKVMPINVVVAVLMIVFALFEIVPSLEKLSFDRRLLPVGGILSGFFGGISGHQGALRSAFLIKCGLAKEAFIGTGVMIACMVDVTRLSVYGAHFATAQIRQNLPLLFSATLCAFLGAYVGNKLVKKITLKTIQIIVAVMLFAIAICLGTGII